MAFRKAGHHHLRVRDISFFLCSLLNLLALLHNGEEEGSIPRAPSSLPSRSKKSNKKAKKKKASKSSSAASLTQEELSDLHFSQYKHGPQSILYRMDSPLGTTPQRSALDSLHGPSLSHHFNSTTTQRLENRPALVLNADYQPMSYLPLSLWHWQDAVKAVFNGKVTVVDVYPDVIVRATTLQLSLPSVIALNDYVPTQHFQHQHAAAFTKRHVFLRDEYRCQYCHGRFDPKDLSLDHVQPRCLGGRLEWENAVTCCKVCNGRKGSLTLKELSRVNMKLTRLPFKPSQFDLARIASSLLSPRKVHVTWEPYLGIAGAKQQASAGDGVGNARSSERASMAQEMSRNETG
jgi:5-methylcytosine-specific restriction endonuclease McrA